MIATNMNINSNKYLRLFQLMGELIWVCHIMLWLHYSSHVHVSFPYLVMFHSYIIYTWLIKFGLIYTNPLHGSDVKPNTSFLYDTTLFSWHGILIYWRKLNKLFSWHGILIYWRKLNKLFSYPAKCSLWSTSHREHLSLALT